MVQETALPEDAGRSADSEGGEAPSDAPAATGAEVHACVERAMQLRTDFVQNVRVDGDDTVIVQLIGTTHDDPDSFCYDGGGSIQWTEHNDVRAQGLLTFAMQLAEILAEGGLKNVVIDMSLLRNFDRNCNGMFNTLLRATRRVSGTLVIAEAPESTRRAMHTMRLDTLLRVLRETGDEEVPVDVALDEVIRAKPGS